MMQKISYPPRVDLARLPTPLQRLQNLNAEIDGPTIWIKRDDLTEGPAGGNKLRKLEFSIGQALEEGADVLITAGAKQSNHCRQTAFAAARLGLRCHLVLVGRPPRSAADGNLLLDELMGAEITYISGEDFDDLPEVFETLSNRYRESGSTPFCIPVGASDAIGLWGYIDCVKELKQDFDQHGINPSHIVAAVGSAGTHAGLMLGTRIYGLDAEVLGVCVARDELQLRATVAELLEAWDERYCGRYDGSVDVGAMTAHLLEDYVAPGIFQRWPGGLRFEAVSGAGIGAG